MEVPGKHLIVGRWEKGRGGAEPVERRANALPKNDKTDVTEGLQQWMKGVQISLDTQHEPKCDQFSRQAELRLAERGPY